jgi:hypothetical protein
MIILSSFKNSSKYLCQKYSVSRWQPAGFNYPELLFLAPFDNQGRKILLRDSINSLEGYRKAFIGGYVARWEEVKPWLDSLIPETNMVLCCWCPYSKPSREQLKKFGTYACHLGLIAQLIEMSNPEIEIILDDDRIVEEWKPIIWTQGD